MVKPKYRFLFYTTTSCVEYARAEYVGAKTDEAKMLIFTYNEIKWAYYKDEVRDFTHANWARWKEEEPAWFTEEVIQRVPDEYIPIAALASLNAAAHGGQRRRSSLGLVDSVRRRSVAGSLRESSRETGGVGGGAGRRAGGGAGAGEAKRSEASEAKRAKRSERRVWAKSVRSG